MPMSPAAGNATGNRPVRRRLALAFGGIVAALGLARADDVAPSPSGAAIYRQHCQRCHGADGQGSPAVPVPLAGERPIDQLAALIDATMPEDDPDALDAAASRRVAAYVHETFSSPVARERFRPPRVELARLTVRQHRHVIADLVGAGGGEGPPPGGTRGLSGSYFKGRAFDRRQRVIERIDPLVRFDFGTEGPDPEAFEPGRFAIRWTGSVVPTDTGWHEFVVRTEHAVRLMVNQPGDARRPIVDAWVKSGPDTEFRGGAMLLGGRPHPIVLEFSKANQGVDEPARERPTRATIELLWRRPGGMLETVPQRCLLPDEASPTLVLATPFPPDDRSTGYDRGTAVSREWLAAATAAALETADYVAADVERLTGVPRDAPDRGLRLAAFAASFAGRAFGRPLDEALRVRFVDRAFAGVDPDTGLRRALLAILESPRFLFRAGGPAGAADPHRVAGRLALGLWDSIPDRMLVEAVEGGGLATADGVRRQAERMVADPRARAKLRDMLVGWMRIDQPAEIGKDPAIYPQFTAEVAADLRTSLELQLATVLDDDGADFRRLFTDDRLLLNGRLAPLYGVEMPATDGFRTVRPDDGARAGVLTHPYMMALLSYRADTSPIHRGVFLARGVLGNVLRPPQEAVAPLAPDLHPGLTTRQRVELQTSPAACQTCHQLVNPLGFALESFDAIGRHRPTTMADGSAAPVDDRGSYRPRYGVPATFRGARELGAMIAASDDAHEAFVRALFHALVGQPVRAFGPDLERTLQTSFRDQGCDIRRLAVDIMMATVAGPPAASSPGAPSP